MVIGLIYVLDVNIHIFFFLFFLRSKLVVVLTPLTSQPFMACTIFRQFRHRKKYLVSTTFTLPYCTPSRKMQSHMKTKEVTLEPTHPLKRIYTPPSIKSTSHKTNANLHSANSRPNPLNHIPPSTTKNMTHKLSDPTLTDDEFAALTKGLSFVPTPTKTFKQETKESWNKFKTHANRIFILQ